MQYCKCYTRNSENFYSINNALKNASFKHTFFQKLMSKICREINEHEIVLLFILAFIADDLEIKSISMKL